MTRCAAGSSGAAVLKFRAARVFAPFLCVAAAPQDAAPAPSAPAPIVPPALVPAPVVTPVPVSTPTPTPSASPTRATPSPRPTVAPRPSASRTPAVRPAPERPAASIAEPRRSQPPRVVLPAPAPVPTMTLPDESGRPPAPPPGVATQEEQPGSEADDAIVWLIGLAVVALLAATLFTWRWRVEAKRREARRDVRVPTGPMPPPAPKAAPDPAQFWTPAAPRRTTAESPADPQAAAPPPAERAQLTLDLVAHRAGLNLLSAIVEVEVTIRNEGQGEAGEVLVALHLLGASAGQDEALGALFAAPPAPSAQPPFALAPGETRVVRSTLTVSRAAIVPLVAGDRQMFVPVVAVDVRYALPGGGQGQTAGAFMVGATRADGDKLAPFWLDAPPRTLDDVAARPHALSIAS